MEKRLQTILAHAGAASRRGAVDLIESGRIKVDGHIIKDKGARLDPGEHKILLDGKPLSQKKKKYYFLLNKPEGYICTTVDTHDRRKITDIFDGIPDRLYPIGRLDKNTTGAIIVTNDGELTHRLSHPSFEVDKEYTVTLMGNVPRRQIDKIQKGVTIDGKSTSPCAIKTVKENESNTVVRIVIHEGRKRQVRRMFQSIGCLVKSLTRNRYAGLTVRDLSLGEFRELTQKEIEKLKRLCGL